MLEAASLDIGSVWISYFDEEFGNIYYIRNGKEFVQDGKFNREKYISYTGGIFL